MGTKFDKVPVQVLGLVTGVPAGTIQQWRVQRFVEGWGSTNARGRWEYSLPEVVAFGLAEQLVRQCFSRPEALAAGRAIAERALAVLRGEVADPRFLVALYTSPGPGVSGGAEVVELRELEDLPSHRWEVARVVDIVRATEALSPMLKALVAEAEA